jgi:hypothetical protein
MLTSLTSYSTIYTQIIWLGAYFKVQTLGHMCHQLADLWIPVWVHLRVLKWPQNEKKTQHKNLFSPKRMGLMIWLGAYY